jgi:hypothetical protein
MNQQEFRELKAKSGVKKRTTTNNFIAGDKKDQFEDLQR